MDVRVCVDSVRRATSGSAFFSLNFDSQCLLQMSINYSVYSIREGCIRRSLVVSTGWNENIINLEFLLRFNNSNPS